MTHLKSPAEAAFAGVDHTIDMESSWGRGAYFARLFRQVAQARNALFALLEFGLGAFE